MKRLLISIVAENEEDIVGMVQTVVFQMHFHRTHATMITYHGYISYTLDDEKEKDMTNYTLIEEAQ